MESTTAYILLILFIYAMMVLHVTYVNQICGQFIPWGREFKEDKRVRSAESFIEWIHNKSLDQKRRYESLDVSTAISIQV
jgi:hypothetical protein